MRIATSIEVRCQPPGSAAIVTAEGEALLGNRVSRHRFLQAMAAGAIGVAGICKANDRGFECLLIEDATESCFAKFKAATIAMIQAQGGIVGWTTTLAKVEEAMP